MLGKLLKYDFKWINKVMYIYFVILSIITIAVKIIEAINNANPTLLIVIVDKIVSGMFIACAISVMITCLMRIWNRFIQNMYKDESYLTHTLPVTKNQLFNSKIIASILSIILSTLVVVACIAIIYLNENTIESIKMMYQSLIDIYGSTTAICFILGLVLLVLLEIIYMMMAGIFGIVMGYRSNNFKTIKSIIIGVASYGVLSVISLIILQVMSKFANFEIVTEGFTTLKTLKIMGLTFIIVYLIYNLIYYFVTKAILNRGVNVD